MVFRNPETGERKILGGSDRNRKAKALLAAGWELVRGVDIVQVEEEERAEAERAAIADLVEIPGIDDEIAQALRAAGFSGPGDLQAADDQDLLAISGIGKGRLTQIRTYLE